MTPVGPMVRRCRSRTPVALSPILILCLCILWHTIQTWFGDGSNFSLMAPKSYRGIVATPSHHHRITLNMFLHDVAIIMLFAAVGYAAAYSQQRWLAMPHAVEEFAPGPPSPQNGALLAAGLYGANIAYNVINKRVLLAHPHPCLVTGINLCSSSLCCVVCWMLGLIHWPRFLGWPFYLKLMGLAVLHWSGMLFSNISVSEVHISFTHTVKAAEPFFTALFTAVLIGHKPTLRAWLSLLVVIGGIVVASTAEISFTWRGFWAAMASNVVVALRTVLTKMAMDRHILDPLNFQALLQCAAFIVSVPVALLFNLHAVREVAADTAAWPSIVLIGPLVWTFNVASIMVLVHTSTVVHSMIRSMRRPLLVLASIITFGTRITALNALGILFTLCGAFWYRYESELVNKNGHGVKRSITETRQRTIP